MIEGDEEDGFTLSCDHCGEECDELFETFQDAVDYKVDRDNGWASVKDRNDDWQELCPSCNTPEIIAGIKGMVIPDEPRNEMNAAELALKALEGL
jgi:5-methylcytosine-specific restriction endonuclease McrA